MKKLLCTLLCVASLFAGTLALGACNLTGGKDAGGIRFTVEGEALPESVSAELGDLFVMPRVTAELGGKALEVSVSVLDSEGEEVELVNKKFKATDVSGYTVVYSAVSGETKAEARIRVVVSDTKAPTLSIQGTAGAVYLTGDRVEIPECIVTDASSKDLTYTYEVKSPTGAAVTVTDGGFTVEEMGDYTITYTASDANGNTAKKDFVVSCRKAVILNAYETEESYANAWCSGGPTMELTETNTQKGKALKLTFTADTTWGRISVPFPKGEGYWSWEDVQEFEGIQLYVYSSSANQFGLSLSCNRSLEEGKNLLYFSMDEIKADYSGNPECYAESENGLYLCLKTVTAGQYLILDEVVGVYADDYVPAARLSLDGYDTLPERFIADSGTQFAPPAATAVRDGKAMEVTVKVLDAAGSEVTLEGGKFTVSDLQGYTVRYIATDDLGTQQFDIPLTVRDSRIPVINIHITERMVTVGSTVQIPSSDVTVPTGETLNAAVTVKSPSGADVAVTDGKFTAGEEGNYTLTYTATSAVNNSTATETVILTAVKGTIVNDFNELEDVCRVGFEAEKSLYAEKDAAGIKLDFTEKNAGTWKVFHITLRNPDGTIMTLEEVYALEKLEIYLYLSRDMEIGLAYGDSIRPLSKGYAVLSFTSSEIRTAIEQWDENQYVANETQGLYLNIKMVYPGEWLVVENAVAIWPENFKQPVTWSAAEGAAPETLYAVEGSELEIPVLTAKRAHSVSEMEVTCAVTDSKGGTVALTDGKLTVSDLEGYTVTYTAADASGSETYTVSVVVTKADVPVIEVDAADTNEVYRGATVTIPASTVILEGEELTATVTVTGPDGKIEPENGSVLMRKPGTYTFTYSVTSSKGKTAEKEIVYECLNAAVVQTFEKFDSVIYVQAEHTIAMQEDGVKVEFTASTERDWQLLCIAFTKEDGRPYTFDEILAFEKIAITLTASEANQINLLARYPKALPAGQKTTVEFTSEQIAELYQLDPSQYDVSGFHFLLEKLTAGQNVVLHSVVGTYADDYVPGYTLTLEGFDAIPETITVAAGETVTVPAATAVREGYAMNVSVAVHAEDGTDVQLDDNTFLADGTHYTIVYTLSDLYGTVTVEIAVVVSEKPVYTLSVTPNETMAEIDTTVTLARAEVTASTGEAPEAKVSVKGPDGEETLDGLTFLPRKAGNYVVTYTLETGEEPLTETYTVTVVDATLLNGFDSAADLGWLSFENSTEVVPGGIRIVSKATGNWKALYFPLTRNGQTLTQEDYAAIEAISIYATFSKDISAGLGSNVMPVSGEACLTFTAGDLAAESAEQYGVNGFYFNLSDVADLTLTLRYVFATFKAAEETQKGTVLNGFKAINDVEWVAGGPEKTLTENGVQLTWKEQIIGARTCVPIRTDSGFMTAEQLKSFSSIEVTVINDSNITSLRFLTGESDRPLESGKNVLKFTREELLKEFEIADFYSENENGLYFQILTGEGGGTITFVSIVGYQD